MNKRLFFQILYVVLIIVLILTMIYLVYWLQTSGVECVKDPLEFYAKKTGDVCSCFNSLTNP